MCDIMNIVGTSYRHDACYAEVLYCRDYMEGRGFLRRQDPFHDKAICSQASDGELLTRIGVFISTASNATELDNMGCEE